MTEGLETVDINADANEQGIATDPATEFNNPNYGRRNTEELEDTKSML